MTRRPGPVRLVSGSTAGLAAILALALGTTGCFVFAEDPGSPGANGDNGPDPDGEVGADSDTSADPELELGDADVAPGDADVEVAPGDADVEVGPGDADVEVAPGDADVDAGRDVGVDRVDLDRVEAPDVGCTFDDDCGEGWRCGPAGCQVGLEGDPCAGSDDCDAVAPFCGRTETCHDGSLAAPCLDSTQCLGDTQWGPNVCGGRGCHRADFVLIEPPAQFTIGCSPTAVYDCPPASALTAPTLVTLTRPFYAQDHEVTQDEWFALLSHDPSDNDTCDPAEGECRLPVEQVSWWDSLLYANALSVASGLEACYDLSRCTGNAGTLSCTEGITFAGLDCTGFRLPTEAEWELLARGGTMTDLYSGNLLAGQDVCSGGAPAPLNAAAWYCATTTTTRPVRTLAPNAYGIYDAAGNVAEWVWDAWGGGYPTGPLTDPLGPSAGGVNRIYRGGGYDASPRFLQHGARFSTQRESRAEDTGLRLVRTAPAE